MVKEYRTLPKYILEDLCQLAFPPVEMRGSMSPNICYVIVQVYFNIVS